MLGWRRVSPASLGRLPDGAGGPVGAWPGPAVQDSRAGSARPSLPRRARPRAQSAGGLADAHSAAAPASNALPAFQGDAGKAGRDAQAAIPYGASARAPSGCCQGIPWAGHARQARTGRPPAMTFPFHCMWTGIRREHIR